MKKIFIAIKLIMLAAIIASVAYFSRYREVYDGTIVLDGLPMPGVKVRLYEKSDIESWLNNDFVSSFLHWRERKEELGKLDEIHGLHEALFGIKKADSHKTLGEYKKARTLGYTSAEFPDDLFRKMRLDLPDELFLPAKDLFTYRKKNNTELDKVTYFKEFEADFPETSLYNLVEMKNKFEQESWDKILGYKPAFSKKDASQTIHDIGMLDELAATLQQIALNDREVQHLAPLPLMEVTTDSRGQFQFALSRYSSKFKEVDKFVLAAVANPTPRRRVAWLRGVVLDNEIKTQSKALLFQFGKKASPPGFYPKQSIELTEDNLVADISNMDNMMPLENVVPVNAPLEALTFEKPPKDYNFLEAVALLTTKTADHHGETHHGHHGEAHGDHGHNPNSKHDTHKHIDEKHGQEALNAKSHKEHKNNHAHMTAPDREHGAPALPTPAKDVFKQLESPEPTSLAKMLPASAKSVSTTTPLPADSSSIPTNPNPSNHTPAFPHIDILGEWESKADPTQIISISFSEDGQFSMQIDGMAMPSYMYSIDFIKNPHVVTITKTDGTQTKSSLEFISDTTVNYDGALYTKKLN